MFLGRDPFVFNSAEQANVEKREPISTVRNHAAGSIPIKNKLISQGNNVLPFLLPTEMVFFREVCVFLEIC
jgi:hypothetical protein